MNNDNNLGIISLESYSEKAIRINQLLCEWRNHDKKQANVYIRVVFSNDRQIIRFRDMGRPFDPVGWYEKNHPKDPASGMGIRMVISLAQDVKYITAMNLNNLIVTL